jgi:hypothetical protein
MINFSKPGRMLSASKAMYRRTHPDHNVVFGAVVASKQSGKIWQGDIDLDVQSDVDSIKRLAATLNQELYIFQERDARFKRKDQIEWDSFVAIVPPRGDVVPNII